MEHIWQDSSVVQFVAFMSGTINISAWFMIPSSKVQDQEGLQSWHCLFHVNVMGADLIAGFTWCLPRTIQYNISEITDCSSRETDAPSEMLASASRQTHHPSCSHQLVGMRRTTGISSACLFKHHHLRDTSYISVYRRPDNKNTLSDTTTVTKM